MTESEHDPEIGLWDRSVPLIDELRRHVAACRDPDAYVAEIVDHLIHITGCTFYTVLDEMGRTARKRGRDVVAQIIDCACSDVLILEDDIDAN